MASTDVEEGMRVGVDRQTYKIMLPLPAKIDPSVTMMQVAVAAHPAHPFPLKSPSNPLSLTLNPRLRLRRSQT